MKIRLQNIKQIEPQQKYHLGTISNTKKILGALNQFLESLKDKFTRF